MVSSMKRRMSSIIMIMILTRVRSWEHWLSSKQTNHINKLINNMAKYTKNVSMGGAWAKGSEIQSGTRAKIVSETNPIPSSFLNKDGSAKTQDVCKVRFESLPEALNVSLNRATINALVDAFGEDSIKWQNKVLIVETERVRVAGKAVTALYLIPDGY